MQMFRLNLYSGVSTRLVSVLPDKMFGCCWPRDRRLQLVQRCDPRERERERERERWGISREPLSERRGKIEREIRRSQKHGETVRERERETERERDRW